jgi:epimerase transport system membrane fusion protein
MADVAQTPQGEPVLRAEISGVRPRRLGLAIVLVVFGGFGSWSLLAPLDSAALAPGVVVVKGSRKEVQHLEGGIVSEILVRDGEFVEIAQPLLKLSDVTARAEYGIVIGQYYTAKAAVDRLIAERDGAENAPILVGAPADDPRVAEAVRNEQAVFDARRAEREGQEAVLNLRIEQVETKRSGLTALLAAQLQTAKSLSDEIADLEELLSEGFVDKQRLRELQRRFSTLTGEIEDMRTEIAGAKVKSGELKQEILQLKRTFVTGVTDELAQAQATLFDLTQRRAALEDKLDRVVLRAPVSGLAFGLNTHTVGAVVKPGETLLEIVPQDDELIIDARLQPADIDRIQIGTSAEIRFSAFKNVYTVAGVLTRVSADRLVDEQTGMPYYSAQISVDEGEARRLLGDRQLLPGMPAEVLIKTGERTLFQYLVRPASNALARSLIED